MSESFPLHYIEFKPVWFDSLGAKSSSFLVRTKDVSILVDPGVAIMHPSFPASTLEKRCWVKLARKAIKKASFKANIVFISHYHYDHFTDFDKDLYNGKIVFVKNPNEYINDSQRRRAEKFFSHMCFEFSGEDLKWFLMERGEEKEYSDPLCDLALACNVDFGDYQRRREVLLEKGRRWFFARVEKWKRSMFIPELDLGSCRVLFADGREFKFGNTKLKFSKPLFHGIEYARVGWVVGLVVECKGEKIVYSSDIEGPIIEDYAEWIIREDPNILILDGPSTYLIPYMLNFVNFKRCIENACRILKEADNLSLVFYEHLSLIHI